jgi:hypothetical protein
MRGNLPRDARGFLRRIKAERGRPYGGKPFADFGVAQILQPDAEPRGVGELGVLLPCAREIGIDIDAMANIGDQQEGRPAMIDGQRLGIAFGLSLGLEHRRRPTRRSPFRRALLQFFRRGLAKEIRLAALGRLAVGIGALLRLQHKAIALIGVQAAKAGRAVAIILKHAAFEHIVILAIVALAALGRIDADQRAEAVNKALRICEFRPAGYDPVGNERFEFVSGPGH